MVFCNDTISMCTAQKKKGKRIDHFAACLLGNYRERERVNMFLIKREMLACLPCWCIWLMAAYTSSTISTVQANELYSWWNEGASGRFSTALALGPPYNVTPAEDANQLAILLEPSSGMFCLFVCLIPHPGRPIANFQQYSTNLLTAWQTLVKTQCYKDPRGNHLKRVKEPLLILRSTIVKTQPSILRSTISSFSPSVRIKSLWTRSVSWEKHKRTNK